MALSTIRTAIKTTLEGVSGIGTVHEYERWAVNWSKVLEFFKDPNDKINAWMFWRRAVVQQQVTVGEIERAHIFSMRGMYGLRDDDASGTIFDDLVEEVIAAFNSDETLDGVCLSINPDWGPMKGVIGLQTDVIEVRKFGSVLCHVAEGRLCVLETISS